MKITIEGEHKEIAALELTLKSGTDIETVAKELVEKLKKSAPENASQKWKQCQISRETLICLAKSFAAFHESVCRGVPASFQETCGKCELAINGTCNLNNIYEQTNTNIYQMTGISAKFHRSPEEFKNREAASGN